MIKLIINDSVKNKQRYYRYAGENYTVGSEIKIFDRSIKKEIVDIYSKECKFDFSKPYTYAYLERQDNKISDFNHCYEVESEGEFFIGQDNYSIDMCNEICKDDDSLTTESKAKDFVKDYLKKDGVQSIVSHNLRIVRIIY